MSAAKAKKTAAEKPRVYTPAELEKERISLAIHPIALNLQWVTTREAETAYISIEWLQQNNFTQYLPANVEEVTKDNDEDDQIFIKDLKDFKKIPLVTPFCSKIVVSDLGSEKGSTVSAVGGVKLWNVLKKIEKVYAGQDVDHCYFEGFSSGGSGSNAVGLNLGS